MQRGAVVVGAILLAAFAGCGPRATPDPFVIGHLESRGGRDRLEGEQDRHAVLLAVEANKEPIAGRPIQVLHVDAHGNPTQAYAEAVRLITVNRAGALLADGDTASAIQIAQAANGHNIPVVTSAALPRLGGLNNAFSLNVTAEFYGKTLGQFAVEQLQAKTAVVVVEEADPLHLAVAEAIRDHWPVKETNRVTLLALPDPSAGSAVPKGLPAQTADVYFFAGPVQRLASFSAAWKGDNATKPLVYAGRIEAARRLSALEMRPFYAAALYEPSSAWTEPQKVFAAKFSDRFRVDPDEEAFAAHDCAQVLFEALKQTKVAGPRLREEIGKPDKKYDTLSGPVSFDKHHARRPLHVLEIKERSAQLVKTFGP